jgi:glycosyltransferase involved in cell wall biosynthesis
MHIWIVTQYFPPEIGAAAVRLGRLARLLAADGHAITVLTGMPNYPSGAIAEGYRGRLLKRERWHGVDVRRVWVYASPSKRARARLANQCSLMGLAALRGTSLPRPDVMLVESHPLPMALTGMWLRRVRRIPMVLNVSDLWPESAVATGALSADSPIVKAAMRVERRAYREAAAIIAMTEGVAAGIEGVIGGREKISLIKNGVDLALFRPGQSALRAEMRARLGLDQAFVVAHVGNMSLTYDFTMMLDAAARCPDMRILFVGDGSQGEYVRARAADLPNVTLTGTLPHEDMPGVWAAADAAVIAMRDTSLADGTRPAKLYEAMAAGVPVVAAIRGEGASLIREAGAGEVVPLGDSAGMAAALIALAADPARRHQLSQAGRAYAEQNLAPEQVAAAYARVLQKAAGA